jgi:hypothetical protein
MKTSAILVVCPVVGLALACTPEDPLVPGETGGTTANGGTSGGGGTAASGGKSGAAGGEAGGTSWPQCFANDTVPTAALNQRVPSSDYQTQIAYGGIAMLIGPNRPSCLTDAVVNFDLQELNAELKGVVETLGFPGYVDWRRGYYLDWVILNSGIPGAVAVDGGHTGDFWGHRSLETTEQCPCSWDSSTRANVLHETIHLIQAQLWAFNNLGSGWIHEAHACYLATQRSHYVEDEYRMSAAAAATLQMPHGPIESMGMNTDDSWAGPSDQNAKTYVDGRVRYGLEIFLLGLSLEFGRGFVNCLWIDASQAGSPEQRISSPLSVFQVLQGSTGPAGAAHAVLSFGVRSAILDFAGWTEAVRGVMRENWSDDYWFYMYPEGDGTTAFRPPIKTAPHHQGRNVIPVQLASGATSVTVEFTPDATGSKGTAEHMQAELVYRDTADQPVYGTVFSSGQNTIQIPNGARNGIVNLVVAVTNPNASSGGDDGSGKGFDAQEHFGYEARIVSGGAIASKTTRPW